MGIPNAPTVGRPPANSKTLKTSSGNRTRDRGAGDKRGSAAARRARSEKLLSDPQFKHSTGTGWPGHSVPKNVHCEHCGTMLTYERGSRSNTLEQDKKDPSKGYKYENIQPSCRSCNIDRGNDTTWKHPSKTEG